MKKLFLILLMAMSVNVLSPIFATAQTTEVKTKTSGSHKKKSTIIGALFRSFLFSSYVSLKEFINPKHLIHTLAVITFTGNFMHSNSKPKITYR